MKAWNLPWNLSTMDAVKNTCLFLQKIKLKGKLGIDFFGVF